MYDIVFFSNNLLITISQSKAFGGDPELLSLHSSSSLFIQLYLACTPVGSRHNSPTSFVSNSRILTLVSCMYSRL